MDGGSAGRGSSMPGRHPKQARKDPIGVVHFGHACVVRRLVSVRRSPDDADHPGADLPISAIRTLTGYVRFRLGVHGEIRPTPYKKPAVVAVDQATVVFVRR